jgi:hypothetical protein
VLGVPIGRGNLPIVETTKELVAAGLDRIIMSSVWGYHATIHDQRGDGKIGANAFRFAQPPFDPVDCPVFADELAERDWSTLVSLEAAAVQRGQAWLRHALGAAGIDTVQQR